MRCGAYFGIMAVIAPSLAVAQTSHAPEGTASSIERGFRACLLQISSNGYLTDSTAEALAADKLIVREDPPSDVTLMAGRLFPEPVYVKIADGGEGNVWVVAGKNRPVCKVTFSDHDNPLKERLDFSGKLHETTSWTADRSLSGSQGGLMREAFVLDSASSGTVIRALVDGPQTVLAEGRGIQAIVTVTVEPKKAN